MKWRLGALLSKGGRLRPFISWAGVLGLALILLAELSTGHPAAAAAGEAADPAGPALISRVLLALLAILALIGMAAGVLKLQARRKGRGPLALISRLPLTRGAQALIVQVRGRQLLLGVTSQSVSLLDDLGEADEPGAAGPESGATSSFALALESAGGFLRPRG
ncbi:MAG: flagellar biosynthetic protein FliO [Acidobacteriota bacterium]